MSNDDAGASRSTETRNTKRSLFSVPKPLKQLFDTFPLTTYAENSFPINAVSPGDKHTLYIFTTQDDSKNAAPSFNPSCLRWQVRSLHVELRAGADRVTDVSEDCRHTIPDKII